MLAAGRDRRGGREVRLSARFRDVGLCTAKVAAWSSSGGCACRWLPAALLGRLPGAQIENLLASLPVRLSSRLPGLTGRLFSALVSATFMADLPRAPPRRGPAVPGAHRARACRIADVLIDKADAYMIGNIVVSIVAGLAAFAALTGLGVPFAVPLAFVMAVTDLIP